MSRPLGRDAAGAELERGALSDIARQQAEHDAGLRFEPLEQHVDAGHDGRPRRGALELPCQKADVALTQGVDASRLPRLGLTRGLEHLGHDLGIGLAVEPDPLERRRGPHRFGKRGHDGTAPRAGGEENGPIDVEQDELPRHRSSSRLTATSRSRSDAARLPGDQGSCTIPPTAIVE